MTKPDLLASPSISAMEVSRGALTRSGSQPDRVGHLCERIAAAFASTLGSGEHAQIVGLIGLARKRVIEREAAMAVLRTLDEDTWSIETHLHLIRVVSEPTWYEWPLPTRSGWGGGDDALTGCLVIPHPVDGRLLTIVTAWHGAGDPTHSYAVGLVHFDDLEMLASRAALRPDRDRADCLTRIMSNVGASIPEGFRAEIDILTEGNLSEGAYEASMRSATSEIPFLLALMLAADVDGGLVVKASQGDRETLGFTEGTAPSARAGVLAFLRNFLGRSRVSPRIAWHG